MKEKNINHNISLDELFILFNECQNIAQIRETKKQIEQKIQNKVDQQIDEQSVLEEEIKIYENQLICLNQEIRKCGKNMEIEKCRYNKELVLKIDKDSVVKAENVKESLIENLLRDISGYKNIEIYQDDMNFYILIKGTPIKDLIGLDPISLDHCDRKMCLFNLKNKFTRVLYNLIIKRSNLAQIIYDQEVNGKKQDDACNQGYTCSESTKNIISSENPIQADDKNRSGNNNLADGGITPENFRAKRKQTDPIIADSVGSDRRQANPFIPDNMCEEDISSFGEDICMVKKEQSNQEFDLSSHNYDILRDEIRSFNIFFSNTVFFKADLDDLSVQILLKCLADIVMEYKDIQTTRNIGNSLVSVSVIKFVIILNLLNKYSNKNNLKGIVLPNVDQAIKNFFSPDRSNSLYEKLVNFSDACYFIRNFKNDSLNMAALESLQEIAFENVYTSIEFDLKNQEDADNLKQIAEAFSYKVEIIFKNHWKITLKSFLLDKIYESFFEHISTFSIIKEYDAFELISISKILVDLGIEKLNNFPKIFMTRKKGDCDVTNEEFGMIMEKLKF